MKVDVAVHGRFHGFDLASGLYRKDALSRLYTTYPAFAARRFVGPAMPVTTAPYLEFRRRLSARTGLGQGFNAEIPAKFGRFLARNVASSQADILVGWSSATLEAVSVARDAGMKVVIDRGCTHIDHQTDILAEAYRAAGLEFTGTSAAIAERERAEYELADAIAVPSRSAADSFIARGISGTKLIVARLGVDVSGFSPPDTLTDRAGRRPRILFVGAVGIRKGAGTLIRAFAEVARDAELQIVGPVEESFRSILDRLPMENVSLTGAVPRGRLKEIYREADIFCLPSVEEGFGMVVLEAMASGLPVVVSDQVGAVDAVDDGGSGIVFPASDTAALADALRSLVEDAAKRRLMGTRARERAVGGGNEWKDYIDRLMPAYEKLIA